MGFLNISSYALGLVFIVLVAVIWSFASVVVQYLYRDQKFDAPFLLTYIGTSLFVVQIPLNRLYNHWLGQRANSDGSGEYDSIPTSLEEAGIDQTTGVGCDNVEPIRSIEREGHWTERDHMIAAAKLSPFWFISNYAYNASLQHTSISSSTVLVNTGSLFTFLIALTMRDEKFSCWKLLGVLFGTAGSILTGFHDAKNAGGDAGNGRMLLLFGEMTRNLDGSRDEDDLHVWGDILSVISASFYGIYTVMVRVLCPQDESLMSMQLFFGYVGMWNMVVLSPVAIYQVGIAHSATLSALVFGCLVVTGLFNNVLSDYLWARSVVLTSATAASVGLGLTIPFAFLTDVVMGVENVLNPESILGAGFVLCGFVLVNLGHVKSDSIVNDEPTRTTQEGDEGLSMETLSWSENDLPLDDNSNANTGNAQKIE